MSNNEEDKRIETLEEEPTYTNETIENLDNQTSKEERDANAMENVTNNAAEVAKKSSIPIAKAAGYVHSGLNKITKGKYGELVGKYSAKANKLSGPAGKLVQNSANKLSESGIANKIGKIANLKKRNENPTNADNQSSFANKRLLDRENALLTKKNNGQNDNKENGNTLKEQAKKVISNKTKEKTKKEASKALIKKIITSNPWILVIIAIIIFILLLLAMFTATLDDTTESSTYGLSGYKYYHVENLCKTVRVFRETDDGRMLTAEVDFEKEYIPGVINAEIGYFANNIDMAKLFAIAARSFAVKMLGSNCEIEGSDKRQAFTFDQETRNSIINNPEHPIMKAVNETYGLVFVKNGELQGCYYDAACYRKEDDEYYYLGYGSLTLGEEHQQAIPKSWAETQSGLMGYINGAKQNGLCYHNHGYGISTYGALYLATNNNYNYEQLMKYYFGDGELYSLYEANDAIETSTGTNDILATNLGDFLAKNGTSTGAFNEYILSEISKAGFGTREAVVAAAKALVSGLYENYQARLPYTLCGQHGCMDMYNNNGINVNRVATSFYGVDANWGTEIHNKTDGLYHYSGGVYNDAVYSRYGPDCSGFVSWVLHNAGFDNNVLTADSLGNLGRRYLLDGTKHGQPGDLIHHTGHIMLIVGINDADNVYYIAHAAGGADGVKINTMSYNTPDNYVVDMTEWYSNHNANIDSETFRNGYLDGYNGEYASSFINTRLDKGVFFVGDSRTVGLCYVTKLCSDVDNCVTSSCDAKGSQSFNWFKNQKNIIKSNKKGNVVINMGVNDLAGNGAAATIATNYFSEYENVADSNSNKTIYIMSVNPIKGKTTVKEEDILTFNRTMQSLIRSSGISNLKYIDTYNNVEFDFPNGDGIHYTFDTYQKIYDYVIGVI